MTTDIHLLVFDGITGRRVDHIHFAVKTKGVFTPYRAVLFLYTDGV